MNCDNLLYDGITDRYYQINTENASFINVALSMKDAGLKDWATPLYIKNWAVALAVNPFHPRNAHEEALVLDECRTNPWYFFREILRIFPQPSVQVSDVGAFTRFQLKNDIYQVIHHFFELNNDLWYTGPRQISGKSTTMFSIICYILLFMQKKRIYIVVDNEDLAFYTRRVIEIFVERVPGYLSIINNIHFQYIPDDNLGRYHYVEDVTGNVIDIIVRPINRTDTGNVIPDIFNSIDKFETTFVFIDECEGSDLASLLFEEKQKRQERRIQMMMASVTFDDMYSRYEQSYRKWDNAVGPWHSNRFIENNASTEDLVHIVADYKSLGYDDAWISDMANFFPDDGTLRREISCYRDAGNVDFSSANIVVSPSYCALENVDSKWISTFKGSGKYKKLYQNIFFLVKFDNDYIGRVMAVSGDDLTEIPEYHIELPEQRLYPDKNDSTLYYDKYGRVFMEYYHFYKIHGISK